MLTLTIPRSEFYDSKNNRFYNVDKPTTIQLEHSLISLQKWESKWHKPFLHSEKSTEEVISYVKCMCLTPNVKEDVFYCLSKDAIEKITAYIDDPMTATWFRESKKVSGSVRKKRIITAELIYYWMISLNIPSEYKKWHLNQLLTLIRVIEEENAPKKKRSKREIMEEYQRINEENKKKYHTSG